MTTDETATPTLPAWYQQVTDLLSQVAEKQAAAERNLAEAKETIVRLTADLAAAQARVEQHAPSIDRLTSLLEAREGELADVKAQNTGLRDKIAVAAEQIANHLAGEPVDGVETPLLRAAESLAAFFGNEIQKRAYLRKRGWRQPDNNGWDHASLGKFLTMPVAMERQAAADGRMFESLLVALTQPVAA